MISIRLVLMFFLMFSLGFPGTGMITKKSQAAVVRKKDKKKKKKKGRTLRKKRKSRVRGVLKVKSRKKGKKRRYSGRKGRKKTYSAGRKKKKRSKGKKKAVSYSVTKEDIIPTQTETESAFRLFALSSIRGSLHAIATTPCPRSRNWLHSSIQMTIPFMIPGPCSPSTGYFSAISKTQHFSHSHPDAASHCWNWIHRRFSGYPDGSTPYEAIKLRT